MPSDVVIVGGGVIGLSIARESALRGLRVTLLEQGEIGREASWAGAGMLPPGHLPNAETPAARLRALSHTLWDDLSRELRESTGIDNGYRRCGGLEVRFDSDNSSLEEEVMQWAGEGCEVQQLTGSQLRQREPLLNSEITGGYHLPEFAQVRNPRHVRALWSDCLRLGVEFHTGSPVVRFNRAGERVLSVDTTSAVHRGGAFVLAAGAWSGSLLTDGASTPPLTEPVRGQMALLNVSPKAIRHVVQEGLRYLVPRNDGRLLVGSTMEHVGFEKRTTAKGIGDLLRFAQRLVPDLAEAAVETTWCGLRPGSSAPHPYLGPRSEASNLILATGHFRDGLQLSPATGRLISQLLASEVPDLDLTPYGIPTAVSPGSLHNETR